MEYQIGVKALRLLLVIASYGMKNYNYLRKVIRTYKNMKMYVDIVVITEGPKDLEQDVKVIVGLPNKNPWSLPFAHKKILADNIDFYDLFAYSEDDILVTEENIHAFILAADSLQEDEIAGFMRYEVAKDGTVYMPDVHGAYHWKLNTVCKRRNHYFAEFSNEHAAFYILTRDQLKKAVSSGGFLRAPYEGKYDLLCTAATDPYTSCGFRKVICISAFEKFLIHHLSNRYAGEIGIALNAFKEQINALLDIRNGSRVSIKLCEVEPRVLREYWYKSYYEAPDYNLLQMVPKSARTILTIGCGWGVPELELQKRGYNVTALALDSVIGTMGERSGLNMVYANIDKGAYTLKGRTFDCVMITNLLHLVSDPNRMLGEYARLVAKRGAMLISGPNFDYLQHLGRRALRLGEYRKLQNYETCGFHILGINTIKSMLVKSGFYIESLKWINFTQHRLLTKMSHWAKRLTARNWIILAQRNLEVHYLD